MECLLSSVHCTPNTTGGFLLACQWRWVCEMPEISPHTTHTHTNIEWQQREGRGMQPHSLSLYTPSSSPHLPLTNLQQFRQFQHPFSPSSDDSCIHKTAHTTHYWKSDLSYMLGKTTLYNQHWVCVGSMHVLHMYNYT